MLPLRLNEHSSSSVFREGSYMITWAELHKSFAKRIKCFWKWRTSENLDHTLNDHWKTHYFLWQWIWQSLTADGTSWPGSPGVTTFLLRISGSCLFYVHVATGKRFMTCVCQENVSLAPVHSSMGAIYFSSCVTCLLLCGVLLEM